MNQLNEIIRIMKRVEEKLDTKYINRSSLFGNEKDESFKGSIGAIYQSFGGEDVYPTLEEKAANLLFFVTEDHSFSDENKRIAATMFLYFLDKNRVLFRDGEKLIDDHTLVALTIMIAEFNQEEKRNDDKCYNELHDIMHSQYHTAFL